MNILFVIVGLVAAVSAKDLIVGHEGGIIIFEQNVTASPAIWRQARNLTVNATEDEVITRVVVIDNREDKNGEATVVEGGEGFKNVTIELKSPAVFRGFDFEVQVFAKPEEGAQIPVDNDQQIIKGDVSSDTVINEQAPKKDEEDVIQGPVSSVPVPIGNEQETQNQDEVQVPKEVNEQVIKEVVTPVPTSSTTVVSKGQEEIQVVKDEKDIVKEPATSEPTSTTTQVSNGQEVQHPVVVVKENDQQVIKDVQKPQDVQQPQAVQQPQDIQQPQDVQQSVSTTSVGSDNSGQVFSNPSEAQLWDQAAKAYLQKEEQAGLLGMKQIPKRFEKY